MRVNMISLLFFVRSCAQRDSRYVEFLSLLVVDCAIVPTNPLFRRKISP